jgi:ATP-binding cassette subfamily B protein
VIKAYGIEPRTHGDFTDLADGSMEKNIDLAKVQALFFPLMILLIGASNLLVVYVGGKQFIDGKIAFGTIVEFLIYVNMLTWPVAIVGWVSSIVQQAEASQKRINDFLKIAPKITNLSDTKDVLEGKIEFKRLNFTYPDTGINALKDVSFTVEPGQTLAIVGHTGAGKSTILEIIGRLYDVPDGTYLVDDKPVKEVNLKRLREQIGYVPQDAFLFSESIRDNIRFGKQDADDEQIVAAAKMAAVHDNIIGFSQGYQTILGERGITLSGGQKQRVSIARAIIADPTILLLDDCLSAVDTETEEAILQNLKKVTHDTTTIIVSHRVSSAKNADNIIVLEDGRVIQQGNHQELINREGYYRDLYHKQLSEKEI